MIAAAAFFRKLRYALWGLDDGHDAPDLTNWRTIQKTLKSKYLEGNFAPVDGDLHISSSELQIIGEVPEGFEGVFARVGPNTRMIPSSSYHWFDGDGMVHAVKFKDGRAVYTRHQVITTRYKAEQAAGQVMYLRLSHLNGISGLASFALDSLFASLGIIQAGPGHTSTANTALGFYAGRLLALMEGDVPYSLRIMCDGLLETVGAYYFEGQLDSNFTAHPKVDPEDGHMYGFGYKMDKAPFLTYHVVEPSGRLKHSVPITIPAPCMMHDFAMTRNYVIFLDLPCTLNLEAMVIRGRDVFVFDENRASRFGILPKDALDDSNIKWFELPASYIFHTANAWEEGESLVHMVACTSPRVDMDVFASRQGDDRVYEAVATHYIFNMLTGLAEARPMCPDRVEFPRINERFLGRQALYGYMSTYEGGVDICGVLKLGLMEESTTQTPVLGRISFGHHGGECVFVPRYSEPEKCDGEDDGFLITFVYNVSSDNSEVVAYDAKTMSEAPVFRVILPCRVPFGFHGLWINKEKLESQQS